MPYKAKACYRQGHGYDCGRLRGICQSYYYKVTKTPGDPRKVVERTNTAVHPS